VPVVRKRRIGRGAERLVEVAGVSREQLDEHGGLDQLAAGIAWSAARW
jgi:hypothetical protein